MAKVRAATVRVMFKVEPGGMAGDLQHWIEHVNNALGKAKYADGAQAPACYADFEVIDAMLMPDA